MEWLAPIAGTGLARALIRSPTLYIFVSAGHILSLGTLIGASMVVDLRLLGRFRRLPLVETAETLWRLQAAGLALAVLTGLMLFSVRPVEYATNTAFLVKLVLVGLGTANAVLVHVSAGWGKVRAGEPPSLPLKLAAAVSLLTWISAVLAGRWIGFL